MNSPVISETFIYDNISTTFDRGFCMHEHYRDFGLINMNGRMYDPYTSMFLSPDNYIQAPDNSQSFNRYAYCLNNPLKYTDPNGEAWHLAIGAALGGITNLAFNCNNCDGFLEYATAFAVGAASGFVTAATGGASAGVQLLAAAGTSAVTSGVNNIISQTSDNFSGTVDWSSVGQNTAIGGVSGLFSYSASKVFGNIFQGDIEINDFKISGRSIPGQMIKQGVSGFAGGYAGGFVSEYLFTGDIDSAHQSGLRGGITGGSISAAMGAGVAYYNSCKGNYNEWTGKDYDIGFRKNSLTHGFRSDHNIENTPKNRKLILKVANSERIEMYGPDKHGYNYWKSTMVRIRGVKYQVWVIITINKTPSISDFGLNPPGYYHEFNHENNLWIHKH